ncbi:MAG TPA: glycosyltransferase family 2 protein [Vicinamibacterales bacterium]|nr:glycosyltransferase family 2 protein [Vicinamibacterales bacterium]
MSRVSVVIPVYRNRDTLAELHRRVCRALESSGAPFDVIYVDDACPAASGQGLDALARTDPRVQVQHLPANVGQHQAILKGLAQARGDAVVILDADLQDPPEAIPRLLAQLRAGDEAVFAGRQGAYHDSGGRRLTSRIFKRLQGALLGLPLDAGSYVAISRPVVDRVLALPSRGQTVVAMIGVSARRLSSIPVARAVRPAGQSAFSSRMRLSLALSTLAWAARRRLTGRLR